MKKYLTISLSILAPIQTFAAVLGETTTFAESFYDLLTRWIIPTVFTLALLYFFWGIAKYIKDEGQGKEEGRKIMIWGVVALFVMSSVWGLVHFIRGEFNLNDYQVELIPTIQKSN